MSRKSAKKESMADAILKERNVNIFVAIYARYKSDLLTDYLGKFGMHVTKIENETDIEPVLSTNKFDVIITDFPEDFKKIPAFIRMIYAFSYPSVIIGLCSEYNARNSVLALNSGAVCVMSHLTSYDIILSQIQALTRFKNSLARKVTAQTDRVPVVTFGEYSINLGMGKLYYKGRPLAMTPDIVGILTILAENLDNIVPYNTICMKVYGSTGTKAVARLRLQIRYIRKALGMDDTIEILNQSGIGYGLSVANRY